MTKRAKRKARKQKMKEDAKLLREAFVQAQLAHVEDPPVVSPSKPRRVIRQVLTERTMANAAASSI
eukprot:5927805-Prorocentrum_lima.AAC.1